MLGQSVNERAAQVTLPNQSSVIHKMALALVWITFASSGFVFSEPCPTDALTVALIVILPVIGLVRIGRELALLVTVFAGAGAAGLLSATTAVDIGKATSHTTVSVFLYAGTFMIAGFIAAKPLAHSRLIFSGLTVASVIAAVAGFVGYFDLVPDAEIFTKFGRATGTFKDPNVFGPFLVPAFLYAIHSALERPLAKTLMPLALAGFLGLGVFLSFSRGAWMNLLVALGIYVVLAFLTAPSNALRQKIAILALAGATLVAGVIGGALQIEKVATLVTERASVAQSYDVGPDGRFGGQEKAIGLILEHPLGIGAGQFALVHHHEEPHNVYLSMPLNAGWLGAGLYMLFVGLTLIVGFRHCFKRRDAQPLLLIAFAAFAANAFEGVIIDTDHWRHFYILMAIVWGISTAPAAQVAAMRLVKSQRATEDFGQKVLA